MFGLSFSELLVIGVVALVAVGPQKLPGMLRTLGEWARKLRNLTHEMRTQSGIDEILRSEGIHGGLNELRGLMRGGGHLPTPLYTPPPAQAAVVTPASEYDPYAGLEIDATKEYPPEGPDAYGALPDDLYDDGEDVAELALPAPAPEPTPAEAGDAADAVTAPIPRASTGS